MLRCTSKPAVWVRTCPENSGNARGSSVWPRTLIDEMPMPQNGASAQRPIEVRLPAELHAEAGYSDISAFPIGSNDFVRRTLEDETRVPGSSRSRESKTKGGFGQPHRRPSVPSKLRVQFLETELPRPAHQPNPGQVVRASTLALDLEVPMLDLGGAQRGFYQLIGFSPGASRHQHRPANAELKQPVDPPHSASHPTRTRMRSEIRARPGLSWSLLIGGLMMLAAQRARAQDASALMRVRQRPLQLRRRRLRRYPPDHGAPRSSKRFRETCACSRRTRRHPQPRS